MGFRGNYTKTLDDLYQEEIKYLHHYSAKNRAKERLRMYANLFTRDIRKQILKKDSICALCGSNEKLTIDHIKPISKGGKNEIDNIQILCFKCNRNKSDKY